MRRAVGAAHANRIPHRSMSQPTRFHIPIAFVLPNHLGVALAGQEPKSTPDVRSGEPGSQAPAGTGGTTGAAPKPPQGQPAAPCGGDPMVWMIPLFLVLMYFMMIRPEQRRRKEQQALLASVKQGDRVVTVSGMHGVVGRLTEKTVTLRVDTIEITFDRSAVARIERGDTSSPGKS